MPVKISIKGDENTNEYKDALELKQIFENEFSRSDTNGEILIISSATLIGQEVKDVDLIVLGNFENYCCKIKTKAETGTFDNKEELELKERQIYVNSFCFTIETKKHRAEDIQLNGVHLLVKYNNKWHDATTQSEKQKYSLMTYIKNRLHWSPHVYNFIWFRNINSDSINKLLGNNKHALMEHNYLPNTFHVPFLFQLGCIQATPFSPTGKDYARFRSCSNKQSFDINEMSSAFDLFNKVRQGTGQLTRRKIEQITNKLLDNQQYAQVIGEKFIIISGRAGTGKTIKLLRIACDLALNKGARCLILTYNHALVSDIKRTLALAGIPDGIDDYTVHITTLHKFFHELLIGFGIAKNKLNPDADLKYISNYLTRYDTYLQELYDYIDSGLIQDKEIQDLMRSRHDTVAWDYILIDESQDWGEFEKSIIFRIFGKEKVIIADGVDQLIRTQKKCNWVSGLRQEIDYKRTNEKKGLRQEVNLVSFINSYAQQLGIIWEVEPKPELIGGKIIISLKEYSRELHEREVKRCKEYGNSEYEMMFLVPPSLVDKVRSEKGEISNFSLIKEFQQMGINIWDGTSKEMRTEYPVDLSQHRLLQYESCRGLEGWTVVCLYLDEFMDIKKRTFKEEESNQLTLETFEEKRDKFVHLWSLIPLTRAIDTLVITLKDKNSTVGKALRKVYEQNPDFVEWIE